MLNMLDVGIFITSTNSLHLLSSEDVFGICKKDLIYTDFIIVSYS